MMHSFRLTLLASTGGAATYIALPLETSALTTDPGSFIAWWETTGTSNATVSVIQLMVIIGFAYVAVIAALSTLASTLRLAPLGILAAWLAVPPLRRSLTVGALAGTIALPSAALADDASFRLVDSGPQAEQSLNETRFVLSEIGPSEEEPQSPKPPYSTSTADSWLVEEGDNMWSIAKTTLASAVGYDPPDSDVAVYWRALIAANTDSVADPDLIQPGQVLTLPPVRVES